MGEELTAGFDPDHFFSTTPEAYHNMVTGLAWLRSRRGDAAVFRTCFLEEFAAAGADVSDIRVINEISFQASIREKKAASSAALLN